MKPITDQSLTDYLVKRMPDWRNVAVSNLHRLPMGASRETFRCDLAYDDAEGHHADQVILRRDPPGRTGYFCSSRHFRFSQRVLV